MKLLFRLYVLAFVIFIVAPIVAITAGSLTESAYVVFPPEGLTLKWYAEALREQRLTEALMFSLVLAAVSATVAALLAMPLAIAIARMIHPLNKSVHLIAMTPAMLPSVFFGLALLIMYSKMQVGSGALPLLAGHVVISIPFVLSLVMVGLASLDEGLIRAARSLGASPFKAFLLITLPLISWSLAAGWGFGFLISFGALEVSLFLSSSTTVTLPVQIYSYLDWSPLDPKLTAVSSGVVIITLVVLVGFARIVRLDRFLKHARG